MNLDQTPDIVCFRIIQYLPFQDKVRIGGVCRRFKDLSDEAISRTTVIDLTSSIFLRTSLESMARLIELCAGNLQKAIFWLDYRQKVPYKILRAMVDRIEMFSTLRFPRLITLVLTTTNHVIPDVDDDEDEWEATSRFHLGANLPRLLSNCPNLRQLDAHDWTNTAYWVPFVCEKLEVARIHDADVTLLKSLVNCPNVRSLVLELSEKLQSDANGFVEWPQALNQAFSRMGDLQELNLRCGAGEILRIDQLVLRPLVSLRSLVLREVHPFTDQILTAISKLIQLECLELRCYEFTTMHVPPTVSRFGMGNLAGLKKLRRLKVFLLQQSMHRCDIDEGVRQLAQSLPFLEEVVFDQQLHQATVAAFINHCPHLQVLGMSDILDVTSEISANAFVMETVSKFTQKNLIIEIYDYQLLPWVYERVRDAWDRVNADANGRSVRLRMCVVEGEDRWYDKYGYNTSGWKWPDTSEELVVEPS